ncbi:MAG TPA: glycosyltransferase [Candidatus Baltobacteraceae bacterium]|nr:glycosyltransferase [Candidatus Baltobacteraceae bacterium]
MPRKRRAVVTGFHYYARFLADLMNEHCDHWEMRAFKEQRLETLRALFALRKADALICFGGPAPDAILVEAARKYGVRVIVVWAGSDVMQAQQEPQDLQVINQQRFHHIADGEWLVGELDVLGLHAEYEPLTAVRGGKPFKPLPRQFRVLTYLPEPRRDFYGAPLVYEIARRMPDVPFTVVGAGQRSLVAPPNVQFHGYVNNMADVIDDSTVLLRLPQHDGKSMLVLEALARARHVVWNYDFPHVRTAHTVDEAMTQLQDLRARHTAGTLTPNYAGHEYVLRRFGREQTAARFEARLDRIVAQGNRAADGERARIAVSGLQIFCADVAGYGNAFAPQWDVRLLRTNSRMEILTAVVALRSCRAWYSIGNPLGDRWLTLAARLFRKPRIIHWVGSDILMLANRPELRAKLARKNILHLAEAAWTAQELRRLGLEPRIAPLPPRHHHGESTPLPQTFTVMLYVPRTRTDFYGRRAFEHLMKDLRGKPVRYLIVGGGKVRVPEGVDVENFGWRDDLREAYRKASVLLRFTPHDGLSLMVLEALSYGRHVIWTQPFPFVRQVRNYADIQLEVTQMLAAHERGELRPQEDASEHVRRYYSPEACMRKLAQAWSELAQPAERHKLVARTS